MATAAQRLVTEAALTTKTVGVVTAAATGRVALTLPGGGAIEVGTTGDRNITSLCTNVASGAIELIRTGYTVTLSLTDVKLAVDNAALIAADTTSAGWMFQGFRIGVYSGIAGTLANATAARTGRVSINRNGGVTTQNTLTTDVLNGAVSWITQSPWPTALPGAEGLI